MKTKLARAFPLIPIAVLLVGAAAPQVPPIAAAEAAHHMGKTRTVCGFVAEARWEQGSTNRPTFLNFDKPYSDQTFSVVIWEKARPLFKETPETKYLHRRICVRGEIKSYKKKPEIIVDQPSQIWIAEEH